MRSTVSSAIKTPSLYLWVVLQRPLHRPAQAVEQLEYFHTRDLRASTIRNNGWIYKSNYERHWHADQSLPNGKILGYGSLDHNKVIQRREDAALTNPIAHHRIKLGISISP
jgi:hypothetical protein